MVVEDGSGKMASRLRERVRIPVMVGATLLYGILAAVAVLRVWRHYELIAIFLQAVLLLPAFLYGLKGSGPALPSLPVPARPRFWIAVAMGAFLIGSAALSAIVTQGSEADEVAYLFQARTLSTGHLVAPPPPGAPELPWNQPLALTFNHSVLWRKGWSMKYPLGWPLAMALPAKFGWAWALNPLLGVGILIFTARLARRLGGEEGAFLAVALLVLSPCFLARSVVLMAHPLEGLLVAGACWAWYEATCRRSLPRFALMYLLIGLGFHVRPLTALMTAVALTASAVWTLRRERAFLIRVLATGTAFGALTAGSVLWYNWILTGSPWHSPYSFYRNLRVPIEVSASVPQMFRNMKDMWRTSAHSTLLYFFPLGFLLAGIGFWKNRRSFPLVWPLASLLVALVLGHLVQTEPSGSSVGERYWYEAYFGVAILAALGIAAVASALQSSRRALVAAGCALLAVQVTMTIVGGRALWQRSAPAYAMGHLAAQYRDCHCVVFLGSSPPVFYGKHLNLNGPDWAHANVFYAVDPGPGQRMAWARTLGRERWVVLGYDPSRGVAREER